MKKILLATIVASTLFSCSKKGEDIAAPPPVVVNVPERLEISPTSANVIIGNTAQFTAKYFNTLGVEAPIPTGAIWSSSNIAVATVTQQGLVTGVANGSTSIRITLNAAIASAPFTVVANPNQLASVSITPNTPQELTLNQTVLLSAVGTNAVGGTISGLTFSWMSNNTTVATVMPNGTVSTIGYGSANISATSSSVQSSPVMINVVRQGNFTLMNSTGTAKLKIDNGVLKLQTSANFSVSSAPPDLRIYLSASASNITNSTQIASLSSTQQTSGARSWNVPTNISITQYRYAVVWCAQFGGVYGVADFGL
jgi:hypothetical protein